MVIARTFAGSTIIPMSPGVTRSTSTRVPVETTSAPIKASRRISCPGLAAIAGAIRLRTRGVLLTLRTGLPRAIASVGAAACLATGAAAQESGGIRVDVTEVAVEFEVYDGNRVSVSGLNAADFEVFENGERRDLRSVQAEAVPYNILVLIACAFPHPDPDHNGLPCHGV
jgi:hypothetical protein